MATVRTAPSTGRSAPHAGDTAGSGRRPEAVRGAAGRAWAGRLRSERECLMRRCITLIISPSLPVSPASCFRPSPIHRPTIPPALSLHPRQPHGPRDCSLPGEHYRLLRCSLGG